MSACPGQRALAASVAVILGVPPVSGSRIPGLRRLLGAIPGPGAPVWGP